MASKTWKGSGFFFHSKSKTAHSKNLEVKEGWTHGEVGEVVDQVGHVLEDVPEFPLDDLDGRSRLAAHDGRGGQGGRSRGGIRGSGGEGGGADAGERVAELEVKDPAPRGRLGLPGVTRLGVHRGCSTKWRTQRAAQLGLRTKPSSTICIYRQIDR